MLPPEIRPNPRDDTHVTSGEYGDRRRTIYSGRLHFGPPGRPRAMLSPMHFNGALFLPDGHAYRADQLADATVASDFWLQASNDYFFTPQAEAHFAGDPNQPGLVWIQLGLSVQGYSGSILGYRVTVTVGPGVVVNA